MKTTLAFLGFGRIFSSRRNFMPLKKPVVRHAPFGSEPQGRRHHPERSRRVAIALGAVLLLFGLAQSKSVWRKVQTPFQGQINGVAMSPDGRHIILSGGFSLHSSDRGVTWEQVASGSDIMTFGDNTHLFAVGSSQGCNLPNGTAEMLHSLDYGKTWLGTSVRTPMCFREVFFLDSLHGWAVGSNKDSIVITKDGGKTLTTRPYGLAGYVGGE